jgi:hypothetical protein
MINYDLIEKLSSSISLKDIYKFFIIDDKLANVYGNYEAFINDTFIDVLVEFAKMPISDRLEYEEKYPYWIIVCNKKYFEFIKDRVKYFIKYFKKRKDLDFWTRLKISFSKTKRWVKRINFAVDIFEYVDNIESYNIQIKHLFNQHKTKHIYIYKGNKEFIFELKFNMKLKNYNYS